MHLTDLSATGFREEVYERDLPESGFVLVRSHSTHSVPLYSRNAARIDFGVEVRQSLKLTRHHDDIVSYNIGPGASKQLLDQNRSHAIPNLDDCAIAKAAIADETYTDTDVDVEFETAASNGVQTTYIIGECHSEAQQTRLGISPPLQTSDRLLHSRQHLVGIHSPYFYLSLGTTFAAAHKEDFHLQSVNLLHAGCPKIWIIIPASGAEQYEYHVARLNGVKEPGCDQFVRHQNIILPPGSLKQLHIPYHVVVQRPGDMVFTAPRVYHAVLNTGPNLAQAVNYCNSHWYPPPLYRPCRKQCTNEAAITRSSLEIDAFRPLDVEVQHNVSIESNGNGSLDETIRTSMHHSQQPRLSSSEHHTATGFPAGISRRPEATSKRARVEQHNHPTRDPAQNPKKLKCRPSSVSTVLAESTPSHGKSRAGRVGGPLKSAQSAQSESVLSTSTQNRKKLKCRPSSVSTVLAESTPSHGGSRAGRVGGPLKSAQSESVPSTSTHADTPNNSMLDQRRPGDMVGEQFVFDLDTDLHNGLQILESIRSHDDSNTHTLSDTILKIEKQKGNIVSLGQLAVDLQTTSDLQTYLRRYTLIEFVEAFELECRQQANGKTRSSKDLKRNTKYDFIERIYNTSIPPSVRNAQLDRNGHLQSNDSLSQAVNKHMNQFRRLMNAGERWRRIQVEFGLPAIFLIPARGQFTNYRFETMRKEDFEALLRAIRFRLGEALHTFHEANGDIFIKWLTKSSDPAVQLHFGEK